MPLLFGTKAENLHRAAPRLESTALERVPCFFAVTHGLWRKPKKRQELESVLRDELPLWGRKVLVRSSNSGEDSSQSSMAGAFLTISHIPANETESILSAIDRVFASYGEPLTDEQHVIVQRCIEKPIACGVLLTADSESLSPYYHLSYDRAGHTSAVTGGLSGDVSVSDVVSITRLANSPVPPSNPMHVRLYELAERLCSLFSCPCLDIEFALSQAPSSPHFGKEPCDEPIRRYPSRTIAFLKLHGLLYWWDEATVDAEATLENGNKIAFSEEPEILYLLQVRPIASVPRILRPIAHDKLLYYHRKTHEKLKNMMDQGHIDLLGKGTVYGVMPDWNPAEIIGIKPRPLALSLYRELITDSVWASQRDAYGYRNMGGFPLMISFLGRPYIDSRVSFNSFVPKDIPNRTADKLVNYYLDKLRQTPSNHDKVEFNIAFTCYYPNIRKEIQELLKFGFDVHELDQIQKSLLDLTETLINPDNGIVRKELSKIEKLKQRHHAILESEMHIVQKIYFLLEDCKRFGTKPFAGLARAAFISRHILQSLVKEDVICQSDIDRFMCSLETVSKTLGKDVEKMKKGVFSRGEFLDKYGHLRPGTYDICSNRYDEDFEGYFGNALEATSQGQDSIKRDTPLEPCDEGHRHNFVFSREALKKIDDALSQSGMKIRSEELLLYVKSSIEGREYSKFIFTKALSDILVLIQRLGEPYSLTRDDLSYISIDVVKSLYSSIEHIDLSVIMRESSKRGKEAHLVSLTLQLPQLIFQPTDVYEFQHSLSEPNFVTQKRVRGEIVCESQDMKSNELECRIVFVQSADPGWDWLFSRKISALVTMYGGLNSHMAIRAAELGLPAIIGCGPVLFNTWKTHARLEIDCSSRMVTFLDC